MEASSSDSKAKKENFQSRFNRTLSDAGDVLQSVWVRYNICDNTENNKFFFNNRFYLLFHFNIFLCFILHQAKKTIF